MQYSYPSSRDTLERIRILLQSYWEHGGHEPVVVLFSEADGELADFPQDNFLPVMLEELASVGLEVWLSALAYGARRLLLVDGGSMLSQVREPLEAQLQTAHEILQAMGYPTDAVSLVSRDSLDVTHEVAMPILKPAGFYALKDKRQSIFMAIDHLYEQATRTKPIAILSAGAPFGAAQVDEKACTLCMACVSACPGKALQHGQGEPQLKFIEANCLQCGMCTRTCPEDAIWITPRLLLDRNSRTKPRILCEEEPFNCTACGKPFATRSVINNMLTKLQGHWMFQNERARSRLTMCEDCRVVDAVQDTEVIENGLDGHLRQ
jgi:ferredoxin